MSGLVGERGGGCQCALGREEKACLSFGSELFARAEGGAVRKTPLVRLWRAGGAAVKVSFNAPAGDGRPAADAGRPAAVYTCSFSLPRLGTQSTLQRFSTPWLMGTAPACPRAPPARPRPVWSGCFAAAVVAVGAQTRQAGGGTLPAALERAPVNEGHTHHAWASALESAAAAAKPPR